MKNNINGPEITEKNDKRITAIGKALRKSKIDELPQIINILIGDLNFVGPRPEVEKFVNEYDFSFLKKIKPGLTDFSSILFSSEEILLSKLGGIKHYHKILPIKLELISHYINVRNIWIDCKIIILTIFGLIMPTLVKTRLKKDIYKKNPDLFNKITSVGL
jgi:lipopolysaccharide/colanic/teichoic acid biosynthesis glycosyltransferase